MYYFFYFPLGTEGRLRRVPVVTMGLTFVLAFVHYLLNYFAPTVHLYDLWVLPTDHPTLFQAFTACFVHGGLFHLVGNLLYLVTFGPALEDRIGRGPFLGFYLLAGMASMLAQVEAYHLLYPGAGPAYVLGASGAISGLLGLFAARCWFLRVRVAHATFAFLRATTRGGVTLIPAWAALAAWTALQGIYALISLGGADGGTAYWAHLSGLVLGFAGGLVSGQFREGLRERRLIRARRYQSRGQWYAALGEYEEFRSRGAADAEAWLGEARCHRLLGHRAPALAAYRRGFALLIEEERWGDAAVVAEETGRVGADRGLDPADLVNLAGELEERGERSLAADCFERASAVDPDPARSAVSLERAAEIARLHLGDLERAAGLLDRAADRLGGAPATGDDRPERIDRIRKLRDECRRILGRRVRISAGAGA